MVELVVKNPPTNAGDNKRLGFDSWVGKIPWRRAQQPTSVFLPGKFPWTEESGGLWSTGSQTVRHDWSDLAPHTRGPLNCRLMWLFWLFGVPCHSTCMLGSACVWPDCPNDLLFSCWRLPSQSYEATRFQTSSYVSTGLNYRLKLNHPFREFFIGGV